ncbi:hypothetical protein COLO4_32530 [Corchorus olitorius]|uniref:Uncharacterized protein n=1 Tax=Corchorus olitorius TaxID=93759 RepID=A0A1R3GZ36_9ROSI|nr:hypothetical protein COLO4_32530 [Corchorus olitorius]
MEWENCSVTGAKPSGNTARKRALDHDDLTRVSSGSFFKTTFTCFDPLTDK